MPHAKWMRHNSFIDYSTVLLHYDIVNYRTNINRMKACPAKKCTEMLRKKNET